MGSITIMDSLIEHPRFKALSNLLGFLEEDDSSIPEIKHKNDEKALTFCVSIFKMARDEWHPKDNPNGVISKEQWDGYNDFFLISGMVDQLEDGYHVLGSEFAFLPLAGRRR